MIDREQLAAALGRLDPRDREILDYSLRRRVPDEDLGEIFGGSPSDVARMRAAAVEKLSADLGVQRGSDLGHMLKELLESATWDLVGRTAQKPAGSRRGHSPVGVIGSDSPAPGASPAVPETDRPRAPVLGMLATGETPREARPATGGRGRRTLVAASVALALLVPAGVVAALTAERDGDTSSGDSSTRTFQPAPEAVGDPFPSDPKSANQYPIARITQSAVVYEKPGGKKRLTIKPKTEFGSPRILGVTKRRGDWLGVLAPELENGEIGWMRAADAESLNTVSWSLHTDLSKREMLVRRDGKVVRRVKVGVGRDTNPTPVGRYAVTDKLRVKDKSSPYGCCVLALTGHQVKLPAGWPGGDRLAIHATSDVSGLGQAVSLGCLRSASEDARWMLESVPIGAPVFVKA